MYIDVIHHLRVFDVAHYEDRGRKSGTLLSMEFDGVKIYSISLPRVLTPSSGKNTVGLFRSNDKHSLYAWIDPVSEECHIISETTPAGMFYLAYLAGLAVIGIAGIGFGLARMLAITLGSVVAFGIILLGVWNLKKCSDVRNDLRTAFHKNCPRKPIEFLKG